jgi:beta-galactosidase
MHEALLLPNAEPNEAYHIVAALSEELATFDATVRTARAAVALVFDYESAWAWSIEPQGQDFVYFELVFAFYRGLRRLGLSVDIIPPTPEAVAERKLVVAPGLFTARPDLAEALARGGAAVLLGPRSGSKTPDFHIPDELPPGAFRSLVDVTVRRVETLREGVAIPVDGGGHVRGWREFLTLGEGGAARLRSSDGEIVLAGGARAFYLAGRPDDVLLERVLRDVLACAGLATLDLPGDIRVRDNGAMRFVFNYGDTSVDISSIVGDAPLSLGESPLPPRGVAAFTI